MKQKLDKWASATKVYRIFSYSSATQIGMVLSRCDIGENNG